MSFVFIVGQHLSNAIEGGRASKGKKFQLIEFECSFEPYNEKGSGKSIRMKSIFVCFKNSEMENPPKST